AIAGRADAEDLIERRQAADDPPVLLLDARPMRALVEVAVMCDLVAGVADRPADRRPAFRAVARDKEGRADVRPVQDPEQAGDPRPHALLLLADHVEPGGALGVIEEDRALGVDVEREAGGRLDPVGPPEPG